MLIMLKKFILNSLKVAVVGYILITTFSSNGYQVLDQDTAYKQLQVDKSIHLVDVRELHEFNAGHINGAQLIPLGTIEDSFSSLIPQKDTKIFIYCKSGNRSAEAAKKLVSMGYTNVFDIGGIITWEYGIVR
jgi:rhodanese-related sulfurtransferase